MGVRGAHGLLSPIERLRKSWGWFKGFLYCHSPPPLTDADTVLRSDAGWADAAQAYARAKRKSDAADVTLILARDGLVSLTFHLREQGSGIAVTRF